MIPNLSGHIGDIARRLLGEPNKALSTRTTLRFGNHGSIAVEVSGPKRGQWYDHEHEVGGGSWEMLHIIGGFDNGRAEKWLRDHGIETRPKTNGAADASRPRPKQHVIKTYDYHDEDGVLLFKVDRWGPQKTFTQRAPDGKGGWTKGKGAMDGVRRVPYRLPHLVAAKAKANGTPWRVYIAEGEKDVDNLVLWWGVIATTNPMGAGKWLSQFNRYFIGSDTVIIADNDDAGRAHVTRVAAELSTVASIVRVVERLGGLDENGDISDWIASGASQSDLETLVEITEPYRPSRPANVQTGVLLKSGSTYAPRKVEWEWNGWLPRGKLTVLAGMKTTGKSTLVITWLATITTGGLWPDGTRAQLGDVLLWSGEDDFEDTILPRFLVAGGDPNRIFPVQHVINDGDKRAFDPGQDIPMLYEAAKRLPSPRAVMIDPVVMAIPVGNDSHKNSETRRGLQPLVDFTTELYVATVGITHFTKGTAEQNPIDRVTGSLAFAAVPRVVLAAASDPEGKQRRLVRVASNIGPSGGGFDFLLTQEPLVGYDFSAQRVRWGGTLQGPAKDLLEMKHQTELMRASQFLLDQLAAGPVAVKELPDAARAHGIAWRTVERAKENLPIKARKDGKIWFWELAQVPPQRTPS